MKRMWVVGALLLALSAGPVRAQDASERILPVMVGGAAGIAGGGYVALAVVVAEARAGHYLHDFNDLFGWRGLPVIAGGLLGGGLGLYSPERLRQAILWGYGGMALGAGVGFGVGQLVMSAPEGKWAGAAIGAGAGLVIGYLTGAITASAEDDLGSGGSATVLPIVFTVRTR